MKSQNEQGRQLSSCEVYKLNPTPGQTSKSKLLIATPTHQQVHSDGSLLGRQSHASSVSWAWSTSLPRNKKSLTACAGLLPYSASMCVHLFCLKVYTIWYLTSPLLLEGDGYFCYGQKGCIQANGLASGARRDLLTTGD